LLASIRNSEIFLISLAIFCQSFFYLDWSFLANSFDAISATSSKHDVDTFLFSCFVVTFFGKIAGACFFGKCAEKEKILRIFTSYGHLIRACQILNQYGIVYENYDKIGFNRQNQPILFDFERNRAKIQYLPIEAHVTAFLEKNDVLSLSKSNIEEICGTFLKNKSINSIILLLI
jgi:hypothetical protein